MCLLFSRTVSNQLEMPNPQSGGEMFSPSNFNFQRSLSKSFIPAIGPLTSSRYLLVLCIFFCCVASGFAQVDRAGVSGTVTDPSGRVLPGTRITVTQTATGLHREATSSQNGTYDVPELPVGM